MKTLDIKLRELVNTSYIDKTSFWSKRIEFINNNNVSQNECDDLIKNMFIADIYNNPDFFEFYLMNKRIIKYFLRNTSFELLDLIKTAKNSIKMVNAYDDDLLEKEYIDKAIIDFKKLNLDKSFWYYLEKDSCKTIYNLWCLEYVKKLSKLIKHNSKFNKSAVNVIAFGVGVSKLSYHLNTFLNKQYCFFNVKIKNKCTRVIDPKPFYDSIKDTKIAIINKKMIKNIIEGSLNIEQPRMIVICGQMKNLKYLLKKCCNNRHLSKISCICLIGCNQIKSIDNNWEIVKVCLSEYQFCHYDVCYDDNKSNTIFIIKKDPTF